MADFWRDANTVRVVRCTPYATGSGKVLPLHRMHVPDGAPLKIKASFAAVVASRGLGARLLDEQFCNTVKCAELTV